MSENIELRNLKASDESIIFEWISNRELRKMTGTRGEPNIDGHRTWFERKISDKNNLTKIITYNGEAVGIVGTNEINNNDKNANIYIYIGNENCRKKGIASIALNILCEILFNNHNCHKIVASIRSYNLPSIKLFEKNGFSCEGVQKEQILFDGAFYDRLMYGRIKEN